MTTEARDLQRARALRNTALAFVVSLLLHGIGYGVARQFAWLPAKGNSSLLVVALVSREKTAAPKAKAPKAVPTKSAPRTAPKRPSLRRRPQHFAKRLSQTTPRTTPKTTARSAPPRTTPKSNAPTGQRPKNGGKRVASNIKPVTGGRSSWSFPTGDSREANDTSSLPRLPGAGGRSRNLGASGGSEEGSPSGLGSGDARNLSVDIGNGNGGSSRGNDSEETTSENDTAPLVLPNGTGRRARRTVRPDDVEAPLPTPTPKPRPAPVPQPTATPRPAPRPIPPDEETPKTNDPPKPVDDTFHRAEIVSRYQPPYPEDARANNEEGTVQLRVEISAEGKVTSATLTRSSGSSALDNASLRGVRRWKFSPARRGDTPVASTRSSINFVWRLRD